VIEQAFVNFKEPQVLPVALLINPFMGGAHPIAEVDAEMAKRSGERRSPAAMHSQDHERKGVLHSSPRIGPVEERRVKWP
jgi:hypothetical protein